MLLKESFVLCIIYILELKERTVLFVTLLHVYHSTGLGDASMS